MKVYIDIDKNAREYSKRIAELLNSKSCELTQHMLAEKVQISPGAVSNIIRGKNIPSIEIIQRIAKVFNVSIDYLVGNTDYPAPNLNIEGVCKYTGLSEEALQKLNKLAKEGSGELERLDKFIKSDNFANQNR